MGNKKITDLPVATDLVNAKFEILQAGTNKQADISLIASALNQWEDLDSTISGTTHTLAHTYTIGQGFFLDGVRCSIGEQIVSIVGLLVTFDADYTGQKFTETGFY